MLKNKKDISKQQKGIVDKINQYFKGSEWYFFEIINYNSSTLTIGAVVEFYPGIRDYDITITFSDIFLVSLLDNWKGEASRSWIKILKGDEAIKIKRKYNVDREVDIFEFPVEDDENNSYYVIAKKIQFYVRG